MRFLRGLLFHVARVVAGLFTVVALLVVLIVGGWMYGVKRSDPEIVVAEQIKAPPVKSEPAVEAPAVRIVDTPQPKAIAEPEPPPVPAKPAPEPPGPPIPREVDADLDALLLFPEHAHLLDSSTKHKATSCDGLREAFYRIDIKRGSRASMEEVVLTPGAGLTAFLTLGISTFTGPERPRWTIFSAKTDSHYLTLTLGAQRGFWDKDTVGPQQRLTYYIIDKRRLGLVEAASIDAPPFKRPKSGAPKFKTVFFRCVERGGSSSNEP